MKGDMGVMGPPGARGSKGDSGMPGSPGRSLHSQVCCLMGIPLFVRQAELEGKKISKSPLYFRCGWNSWTQRRSR